MFRCLALFLFYSLPYSRIKRLCRKQVFIRFHDACFPSERERLIKDSGFRKKEISFDKAILYTLPEGLDAAEIIPLLNARPW